ncbi:hypothetical protein AQUCO_03700172v1 [Aquilegia coerulea]|uniref:Cytochrome b561 and DOMON domain-containing protein n=1 Tax=Aquilegia coerulea TaxID=218851 RepID=A0A2G5CTV2_AQUCA|nr:hypothetical protein AQUCO_03700172v1 [Aquilegia coerulea]
MGLLKWNVYAIVMLVLNMQDFFVFAHEQSDLHGCYDVSSLPEPYKNLTGHCAQLWDNFYLRFLQDANNVVTIVLSANYTSGWVSMGFSNDGMMAGSSAMVGWVSEEHQANILQFKLQGYIPAEIIPDKGDLPLTKVPPAVLVKDSIIFLAFQLKYSKPLETQPIILAYGAKAPDTHHHHYLSIHDDKTTVAYNFLSHGHLRRCHGILAMVAWALLLPAGAIVARYFRHHEPLWYHLHIYFQCAGSIIGFVAVVVGMVLRPHLAIDIGTHANAGGLVLMLSILQVTALCVRPDKENKMRKYWNWYHHWVGRVSLFVAATNIISGIRLQGLHSSWQISYGIILSVTVIFVIILEVLLQMRRNEELPAAQMSSITRYSTID